MKKFVDFGFVALYREGEIDKDLLKEKLNNVIKYKIVSYSVDKYACVEFEFETPFLIKDDTTKEMTREEWHEYDKFLQSEEREIFRQEVEYYIESLLEECVIDVVKG